MNTFTFNLLIFFHFFFYFGEELSVSKSFCLHQLRQPLLLPLAEGNWAVHSHICYPPESLEGPVLLMGASLTPMLLLSTASSLLEILPHCSVTFYTGDSTSLPPEEFSKDRDHGL
jgi:hypothetical protein